MHSIRVTDIGKGLHSPGWLCTRPARPRHATRGLLATACASMCPYTTLGVSAGASDTEIKQAYRKLVLQYHPDVNHAGGAERKFMSIQQAYELLTSKSRHPEGHNGRRSDWAFHDWYWSFAQKRRWNSQRQGPASSSDNAYHPPQQEPSSAFHKQPQHQSTLRSQLAGLRHRAAIRANKPKQAFTGQAAASSNKGDVAEATPASSAGASCEATAAASTVSSSADDHGNATIEYAADMSDGCNVGFQGVTDWQAAEEQHAQRRHFTATEGHKQQVLQQMAGLHRRAAVAHSMGDWS